MTVRKVFVDAHYWIALLSKRDRWHYMAVSAREWLDSYTLVTSEMVLTEVLDGFADKGQHLRLAATQMVFAIMSDKNTQIVPQSTELFNRALYFYKCRIDKQWELTDCASILIMAEGGIDKILTLDRHFEQAGFTLLLQN